MLQKLDVENLLAKRWVGITYGFAIILSFGLPWVYPEDYGQTTSVYGLNLTTGSELDTFGDVMGFIMTGIMMVVAALYLWKRWIGHQAARTIVTLFWVTVMFPLLGTGSIEKIWFGYIVTLLLCAPMPTLMFVDWTHRKLRPYGGFRSVIRNAYVHLSRRLNKNHGSSP